MSRIATDQGTELLGLVARIGRGDRDSFNQLYDLTAAKLFGVALRILRERDRAEDVLQESYVAVWEKARDYDPVRGSVMSWLVMIVRNRAIDLRRRYAHRGDGRTDSEAALALLPAGEIYAADRGAELGALSRCLDTLDETPRQAIVLAYAFGLTHQELAVRLTTPIGTIKSWIRRSLERLKQCLDG